VVGEPWTGGVLCVALTVLETTKASVSRLIPREYERMVESVPQKKFVLPTVILILGVLLAPVALAQATSVQCGGFGVITGVPYSAVLETEFTQTQTDGSHVVYKRQVRLSRDSQGRMRWDRTVHLLPTQPDITEGSGIQIRDDVACVEYSLDVEKHIAVRTMLILPPPLRKIDIPPDDNSTRAQRSAQPGSESLLQTRIEDLGKGTIEGEAVEGLRLTKTFGPADCHGTVGLGHCLSHVTVSEIWSSRDLKMSVLYKHSDPQDGDTITRLTNINRSEPDPALFRVPPDYTTVDR
jgi:hypothetical protein